ncbi:MAG TPA: hypothetical protein PKH77_09745 [Anaerolineae bacterium]|nr:hypothetical protein [Anaerolineae bacterium]
MTTMTTAAAIAAKQQALRQNGKTRSEIWAPGVRGSAAALLSAAQLNSHSGMAPNIDTDHILAVLTWVSAEIARRYELRREESQ